MTEGYRDYAYLLYRKVLCHWSKRVLKYHQNDRGKHAKLLKHITKAVAIQIPPRNHYAVGQTITLSSTYTTIYYRVLFKIQCFSKRASGLGVNTNEENSI